MLFKNELEIKFYNSLIGHSVWSVENCTTDEPQEFEEEDLPPLFQKLW